MTFAVSDRSSPRPHGEDDESPAIDVDGLTTTDGGSRGSMVTMALMAAGLATLATWRFDRHDVRG